MPRSLTLAGFALAAAVASLAQQPPDPVSLSGTVVNTVTAAPIRYAKVVLVPAGIETQTDAAGAFRFPNVPPGDYFVMASKPGFAPAEGHEVSLKSSRENDELRLTPLSAIRGRITDGGGEPVEHVTVLAMQSTVETGHRRNQVVSSVETNDRGEYRIPLLRAGAYLVKASGQFSQQHYYGGNAAPLATHEGFAPLYFGGSRDAAGAAPVQVQPGADARADFSLTMQAGHSIRGRITNLKLHSTADLQLSSGDEDLGVNRSSLDLGTGQFEIQGVLDGAYRLRAYQVSNVDGLLFAEQEVVLNGHDVEGITLALAIPPTLKGKLRVEGRADMSARVFSGTLIARDDFLTLLTGQNQLVVSTVADGKFEIHSVFPGKYWTDFKAGNGLYVSSAHAGNTDILATQELVTSAGMAPELDIVLRADGGSVSGTIAPVAIGGATVAVLLVAESCSRPARTLYAFNDNSFFFGDIAPGNYRLHAWKEATEVEFASSTALCALAQSGTPVAVKTGEVTKIQLTKLSEEPK